MAEGSDEEIKDVLAKAWPCLHGRLF